LSLLFEETQEHGRHEHGNPRSSTNLPVKETHTVGSKLWNYLRHGRNPAAVATNEAEPLLPDSSPPCSISSISTTYGGPLLSFNMVLIIGTLGIFNLCTQAFTKLLTVLFSSAPPVGTGMSSNQLGYAFATSIVACMTFQTLFFRCIERILGYTLCYRLSILISSFAFFIAPLLSLIRSRVLLWIGLVCMMTLKIVTEFFGPTSALLLVLSSYLTVND
jgi:hypothetical protein